MISTDFLKWCESNYFGLYESIGCIMVGPKDKYDISGLEPGVIVSRYQNYTCLRPKY